MADEAYTDVNYKSICCEEIPELFLDKLVAKKHFGKFGKIKRFILYPKRFSCTVEYETEDEAERAVEEGNVYNGVEFFIKYAEREVGHVQNTEEWVDADVQAELDAMGGRQQTSSTAAPVVKKFTPSQMKWTNPNLKSGEKEVVSPISAPPKFDSAVRTELETLLRQPANSAEEKYRVLDARDKLIRLLSIKQTDIAKAERRRGICPDMCPEKERLMRDFQRQVSVFETNSSSTMGSISHHRAIKEYSRSSADQEVPLLHELRPESVLKLTMLYLMHNIMDQLENSQVSVGEWFHFVWDRTRSIRKDITQQELCSLDAVELVEQCARFHIHCGARLVAEEPSVFDQKINAENLTKCLQTLKYLYHDLRLKNVHCPREAEFRGYIVLLNLGNSNFLWEIKQLPEDLQQSQEIKRAMEFYNVLQNNNYVRFFNMIRESQTSYLSACILLNYFTKLRVRAMDAIVKSHNWRKDSVFLPLGYLTRILGFEDENAAVHFFGYHGLECSEQRGVMLDRLTSASDYSMDRALKLVESKRVVSVGECICGRPLDPPQIFEKHQPHNSFDENGLLKLEAWAAEDQLRGEAAIAKAKENKLKQNQMLQRSQQLQPHQQWTTSPNQAPSTQVLTNQTDNNLFKIPQVSPQFSPRQQQQSSPQKQFMHKPATSAGFSLFNKAVSTANSTAQKSLFAPKSPDTPTTSTSQTASLFKPASGNLFTSSASSISTDNIFGKAASSNVPASNNLFANRLDQSVASVPRDNNVFQYFQTSADCLGSSPKSIFAAPQIDLQADLEAEKQRQKSEREADELEAQKRKDAEKRQLAIEAEEERKRKLAEEEQQIRAAEAAKVAAAADRKRRLEDLQRRANHETECIVLETVDGEISQIAKNELRLYQGVIENSEQLSKQIINEVTLDEVTDIAIAEYNIICHDRMLLERYFNVWLNKVRKKIEKRRLLETTPMWVPAETHEQIAEQLQHPSTALNLHMIKRYRQGEPCDFSKLLWDDDVDLRWRQSIDICDMIAKHVTKKKAFRSIQQRTYFKMLFNLPAEDQELYGFASLCSKWLQTVLRFPPQQPNESLRHPYISTLEQNVALCVRKVSGTPPIKENGQPVTDAECDHLDGIIFFMSCVDLSQTRRRLHHFLQTCKNYKRLPITFIVYGGNDYDEEELVAALNLKYMVEKNKVSTYRFYMCHGQKADFKFKLLLEHALNYIISKSLELNERTNDLEMQGTQLWLETCLGEEMWRRWQASWRQNPIFGKVCSLFPHVVGLYNAAVENLANIIKTNFDEAPEFPSELRGFIPQIEGCHDNLTLGLPYFPKDWKSKHRQKTLLSFLKRLELPDVESEPPMDVNDLKVWLLKYSGQCIPEDDEKATETAYYAIKSLIEQLTSADFEYLEIPERIHLINYLPIVKIFAFAFIDEQLQKTSALPTEIIYSRKSLQLYLEQPWWLNYEAVKAVTVDCDSQNDNVEENFVGIKDPLAEIEAALEIAEHISQCYEKKLNAEKQENHSDANDIIVRQLNQTVHEIESAEKAGMYDYANLLQTSRKRSRDIIDQDDCGEIKRKPQHALDTETNDVIAKACAVIERVNAFRDIEFKLDYTTSKLDI